MSTRRKVLAEQQKPPTTNAGLWLDKFILEQREEDTKSRGEHIQKVAESSQPDPYKHWFACWQETLNHYGAKCREAEVKGRVVIGLGDESVLETSVTLHHTYGVPYLPGSALKGLAASFACQHLGDEWQRDSSAFQIVFGNLQTAGYVTFFDALPLPNSASLHTDIITVHHKKYYQNKPDAPPADWDSPTPIPFLSATGKYLIALAGPDKWVGTVFEILEQALAHLGLGAKTSSGYGRMQLEPAPVQAVDPDEAAANQIIAEIRIIKREQVAGRIHSFYQKWCNAEISPVQKRRVAEAIISKVKEVGREKESVDKDWYKEILSYIKGS